MSEVSDMPDINDRVSRLEGAYEHLATKEDIAELRGSYEHLATKADIAELKAEMSELRGSVRVLILSVSFGLALLNIVLRFWPAPTP